MNKFLSAALLCTQTYGNVTVETSLFHDTAGKLRARVQTQKLSGPSMTVVHGDFEVVELSRGNLKTYQDRGGKFYLRMERDQMNPSAEPRISGFAVSPSGTFDFSELNCKESTGCEDFFFQ